MNSLIHEFSCLEKETEKAYKIKKTKTSLLQYFYYLYDDDIVDDGGGGRSFG